ncbi:WYL domain-containing protein [Paenibacillus sp. MMS20-IR301]|uniref:helix-turn-helix transcriptional regulator n=1 Tax=Paenibacillus sp. MMS20-IR301 TaxID=2895946 RepID=UPI0028EE16ED|nr:WYL domain-containing protein [Paenibacillus sp. MMS20-IR301]WNS45728.1 WYL domain-containing protein [Paenibacillus sp. MMS20-IR301]
MSHIHRIQWFDQQIRNQCYPNSHTLSSRFEISRRQAQRDIEYLTESLRAPLRYVAKQRGYMYEDNSFVLPHLYITDEEQRVLKYLAYRYSHYDYENSGTIRRIGALLERLTDQTQPEEIRLPVFEVNSRRLQMIELLQQAIQARRVIHVLTRQQPDGPQELYLCPLTLNRRLEEDYVLAAIEGDCRTESFSLSGIRELALTDRHFTPAGEAAAPRQKQGRPLKPFTARLRLASRPEDNAWRGYPVRGNSGEAGDIYEIEFFDPEAFLGQLLTSEWTGLLSPKWLKDKLRSRCRDVLKLLPEQENQ